MKEKIPKGVSLTVSQMAQPEALCQDPRVESGTTSDPKPRTGQTQREEAPVTCLPEQARPAVQAPAKGNIGP